MENEALKEWLTFPKIIVTFSIVLFVATSFLLFLVPIIIGKFLLQRMIEGE